MVKAKKEANAAIDKITEGQAEVLNLKSADAHAYTRARAALNGMEKRIDTVAEEYPEAYRLLAGRASILEVSRHRLQRHAVELPRVTVSAAVEQLKKYAATDVKSNDRQKPLAAALNSFATAVNQEESNS